VQVVCEEQEKQMVESTEDFIGRVDKYSRDELLECIHTIDREQHPDRYNRVIKKIKEINDAIRIKNIKDMTESKDVSEIKYGGFGKRFWATIIDTAICLIVLSPALLFIHSNRQILLFFPLLSMIVIAAYSIYFNTKNGATPGKKYMGLKILKTDLTEIGIREAIYRSSVDIALRILQVIGLLLSINSILQGITAQSGVMVLLQKIQESSSPLFLFSNNLETVWFWSQVVVFSFNAKRRALHDFIANTVVVVEESLPVCLEKIDAQPE
jgi:uncharacterized RDD family membrane protein YckC